jgi:hypothetical protein
MIRKRRLRYICYGVVAFAAIIGFLAVSLREDRVTPYNLTLVKVGMTADEVEQILGPGTEFPDPEFGQFAGLFKECSQRRYWRGAKFAACVGYDSAHRVIARQVWASPMQTRPRMSLWEKIRFEFKRRKLWPF